VSEVRVGLVGLGRFGARHADALIRSPSTVLAAVCSRRPEVVEAFADQRGVTGRYTDARVMLADAQLDAVVIASPVDTHVTVARAAVEHGVACLVEKPAAIRAAEAAELLAFAQERGVLLQCGLLLRFEPQHAALRDAVRSGRLGRIRTIRTRRDIDRDTDLDRGPHLAFETLVHDIDLVLWLTGGRVEHVAAAEHRSTPGRSAKALAAMLHLDDGTVAVLQSSCATDGDLDAEIEIVGEVGTARISTGGDDPPVLWAGGDGHVKGALERQDEHFVACVREGRPSAVASFEDAVEGLRLAEAIVAEAH